MGAGDGPSPANEELVRLGARFRALVEASADIVLLTRPTGEIDYISPAIQQILGHDPAALVGGTLQHLMHPEEAAEMAARRARLHAGDAPAETELRLRHRDGSYRWVAALATNLSHDPVIQGIAVRLRDIHRQKTAEGALAEADSRYRRLLETTSEGVWVVDASSRTTYVNPRLAELLGYSEAELLGRSSLDFVSVEEQANAVQVMAQRRQGVAGRRTVRLRKKDGSFVWGSVQSNPFHDADGTFEGVLAMVTDISEQKRSEEAQSRLAAIVELSDDAIIGEHRDGKISAWNRGAERLYQYTAEEIVGRPVATLSPPDRQAEHSDFLRGVCAGESFFQFETVHVRKDGVPVEVALTISPVRGPAGLIAGATIMARDLTEIRRTQAALRRSQEQLRHAQKMEAVGRLAGGIAHDFNNLLSVILSYTTMVVDELNDGDPLRQDLEQVHKAAERASELTRQLLAFSRKQVLQPRPLDLNGIIHTMESMLRRIVGEDIQLSCLTTPQLGSVMADRGQIEQVIMNLVVNARDAMPDGGRLTIETGEVELDAAYCASHLDTAPGHYVMLAISDTGVGMSPETQLHAFEPFSTTKETGQGTGLGLATVFGVVKQSGGSVWLYSEVGKGTTFKIYLPRVDELPTALDPAAQSDEKLGGAETVLLVEDEEQVRVLVRTVLRRAGYNVLEARNGGEALLTCEQYPATIHLLLTDVVMPMMSGRQLAERLAAVRPKMKVIFMSGYTDNAIVHHGVLDAGITFLQKPITPLTLLRKLRVHLDSE